MTDTRTLAYPIAPIAAGRDLPTEVLPRVSDYPEQPPRRAPRRTGAGRRVARGIVWLLALTYLAVVAFITLTPARRGSAVSELSGQALGFVGSLPLPAGFTPADAEFALNVLMFAPLGVFAVLLLGGRGFFLAAAAGIALSLGIEWLQEFIPTRVSDPRDLFANGMGAVTGAFLALPFAPLLRPQRRRRG